MKRSIKSKLCNMSNLALRLVLSDCLEFKGKSSHDKRVLKAIANYVRSLTICSNRIDVHYNDIVAVSNFWHDIAFCDRDIICFK